MTSLSIIIVIGIFGAVFCGGCVLALLFNRYQAQLNARLRATEEPRLRGAKY